MLIKCLFLECLLMLSFRFTCCADYSSGGFGNFVCQVCVHSVLNQILYDLMYLFKHFGVTLFHPKLGIRHIRLQQVNKTNCLHAWLLVSFYPLSSTIVKAGSGAATTSPNFLQRGYYKFTSVFRNARYERYDFVPPGKQLSLVVE